MGVVTYRFLRYGHREALDLDSVGLAFYVALCDIEYNDAYPVAIEQDGAVLYDEDAIREHLERIYADYYEGRKGIHEVGARSPLDDENRIAVQSQ